MWFQWLLSLLPFGFLGFFGNQASRLLDYFDGTVRAEKKPGETLESGFERFVKAITFRPVGAQRLGQVLYSMFDDNIPQTQNAPVTINQSSSNENPLTINSPFGGSGFTMNGGNFDVNGGSISVGPQSYPFNQSLGGISGTNIPTVGPPQITLFGQTPTSPGSITIGPTTFQPGAPVGLPNPPNTQFPVSGDTTIGGNTSSINNTTGPTTTNTITPGGITLPGTQPSTTSPGGGINLKDGASLDIGDDGDFTITGGNININGAGINLDDDITINGEPILEFLSNLLGGGGGGGTLARVVSGSGATYRVQLFPAGMAKTGGATVLATVPQILASEQIPVGTVVGPVLKHTDSDKNVTYEFQPPVWLS